MSVMALATSAFANSHIQADAQANLEVEAGIGPGNAFYALDRAMERIREKLTFSSEAKAQLYVDIAEERLAEAEVAASLDTKEHVDVLMQEYQKAMEKARAEAQLSQQAEVKTQVAARLEKHVIVLEGLQADVRGNGTIGISTALENSQKSLVRLRSTLLELETESDVDAESETETKTNNTRTSANTQTNASAQSNGVGANVRVGVGASANQ